jgi:hypothetical protein
MFPLSQRFCTALTLLLAIIPVANAAPDKTSPAKLVVVKEDDSKAIKCHINTPSTAHGIVIGPDGKPAGRALVLEKEGLFLETVETDSSGIFEFKKPSSEESITFEAERGNLGSPHPIIYKNGNPVILHVDPGRLSRLTGKVLDSYGRPVIGAQVTLCYGVPNTQIESSSPDGVSVFNFVASDFSTNSKAVTGAHGKFKFSSIFGNMPYRVLTSATGFADCYSKIITVNAGKTAHIPPTKLTKASSIGGQVVNTDGEPVANAQVMGQYTNTSGWSKDFSATTDLTGHFLIRDVANKQMEFTVRTWQGEYGPYTFMPGRKDYVVTLKPVAR